MLSKYLAQFLMLLVIILVYLGKMQGENFTAQAGT